MIFRKETVMKLNILAIFSLITFSILISACSGAATNNAPVNTAVPPKAETASPNSPVAVITPTPAQTTNDAPTLTPVYKALCAGLLKKDEAAVRKVYSAATLTNFAQQMKDNKVTSLLKFLEDDVPKGDCSAKNEIITGDKGVADIVSSIYPNGFKVVFVKENGEWKMTNQSPTFDNVKPSGVNPATK